MNGPGVFLRNISFGFSGRNIFSSFDFSIKSGQWTCLLGPSGCGKSTLLRLISGSLQGGVSGEILFGNDRSNKGYTAWMAQKDLLLPWLTVLENVTLGPRLRGELTPEVRERAMSLITEVGLAEYADALPSALSGGMRQRTALLRTLMEERPVILMDEPFSALDALTRLKLQDIAAQMLERATVLLVTHDPLEALRLGHGIYVMTGRPARLSDELVPPGRPPRRPDDPHLTAMHAILLDRLDGRDDS
ncbi:MAG: ABC transporter ATP-binding protein [Desulfatiglans sp.]|jgi:putative hydroxymethylpyrimidine transport system ATP-binding protein|nr:ABC transporter ATP-binding protein [Thermodesulfobacteriota bacterium]MEE4352176.1 ABC transporter ATP-binding protein [Desulfatiglans sp.]